MDEDDNSDILLSAILSTHEQQLKTLRQRQLSLLKIASFNIILLSILIGLVGISVQVELPIGLFELSIPILFVIIAILLSMFKYINIGSSFGPTLSQELTAEMNSKPRDYVLNDMVRIYDEATERNETRLNTLDRWIFTIILLMCMSLSFLLGLIVHSA